MPEQVHLLVGETNVHSLLVAVQLMKQQTSGKLKKTSDTEFWQPHSCDFNVNHKKKTVGKLRYMHRNPVKRGLVSKPEGWPWRASGTTRQESKEQWRSSHFGRPASEKRNERLLGKSYESPATLPL
jgi:putative transposase